MYVPQNFKRISVCVLPLMICFTATCQADPPSSNYRYAVVKPAVGSWDALEKIGCERVGSSHGTENETFSFMSCNNKLDAGRVSSVVGWSVQPVDQFKRLGSKDSFKIALDAFVNPEAVKSTEVRWFYPAVGATLAEQASWAVALGEKLDKSGVPYSLTTQKPGEVFAAFDYVPEYAGLESQNIGAKFVGSFADAQTLGISLSVEDLKKLPSSPNFGLENGTKIVTFDKDSSKIQ